MRESVALSLMTELGALRRAGRVEAEVAPLLDEAEGLAGQAMPRPGEPWPPAAPERVGEVLGSIQSTIARLQTVATALAEVAEAPASAA